LEKGTSIYFILGYASAIGTVIPVCVGFIRRKFLDFDSKLIFILFILGTLVEILSRLYSNYISKNNILFFNIYQILETGVITTYYYRLIPNKYFKNIILFTLLIFMLYSSLIVYSNHSNALNSFSFTIESIVFAFLATLQFHYLLKYPRYHNIISAPIFWVNSAFLLYFSGSLFLHLFSQYLISHAQYAFFELWGLWHSILSLIFYTLISIGLWKTKTSQI